MDIKKIAVLLLFGATSLYGAESTGSMDKSVASDVSASVSSVGEISESEVEQREAIRTIFFSPFFGIYSARLRKCEKEYGAKMVKSAVGGSIIVLLEDMFFKADDPVKLRPILPLCLVSSLNDGVNRAVDVNANRILTELLENDAMPSDDLDQAVGEPVITRAMRNVFKGARCPEKGECQFECYSHALQCVKALYTAWKK